MSENQDPSVLSLKSQAKALRTYLAEEGIEISHSKALEAVSRSHGFRDWNTACKRYRAPEAPEEAARDTYFVSYREANLSWSDRDGRLPVIRTDVLVECNGIFADDFFEGRYTDKQREKLRGKMRDQLAADLEKISKVSPQAAHISWSARDDADTEFIVNGRKCWTSATHLSFVAIARLAHDKLPDHYEGLSMVYRGPNGAGAIFNPMAKPVRVEGGMVFNAYFTGNA